MSGQKDGFERRVGTFPNVPETICVDLRKRKSSMAGTTSQSVKRRYTGKHKSTYTRGYAPKR